MSDKSIIQLNPINTIEDNDVFHIVRNNIDYKILGSDLKYELKPYYEYTASISQVNPYTDTSGTLLLGAFYTISNYVSGDDFSNMELISGTANTTGSYFRVLDTTPVNWSNGSLLSYSGAPYIVSTNLNGEFSPLINTFPVPITYEYVSNGTYKVNIAHDASRLEYNIYGPDARGTSYDKFTNQFTMKNTSDLYFTIKSLLIDDEGNPTLINSQLSNTTIYFKGYY